MNTINSMGMDTHTHTRINSSPNQAELRDFIESHLKSAEHSWSIGIAGAIGEFMYDDGETIELSNEEACVSLISPRGALRVDVRQSVHCMAYEDVSSCTRSWSQNVLFCLPADQALLEKHTVVAELGVDYKAIRSQSKNMILFDLGIGSDYLQYCVRTDDPVLINILREHCGKSIFENDNSAAAAILASSPARVVISALGRVEIETAIPTRHEDVHAGPHTHLLPAFLHSKKPRLVDIPEGYVEVLNLYPNHPVFDKYGEVKDFQKPAHDEFQMLLDKIGSKEYCHEKQRLLKRMGSADELHELEKSRDPLTLRARKVVKIQASFKI